MPVVLLLEQKSLAHRAPRHLPFSASRFYFDLLILELGAVCNSNSAPYPPTDLNCPTSPTCFQCFHPKAPVFIPTCRDEPSKSYFVKWANLLAPEKARLMFSICVYKVSFRCGEATCHGKRVVRKSEETNWGGAKTVR